MLIDTHAHLWFPDYYPALRDQPGYYDDLEEVLTRAKNVGVEKIIVPGTDIVSSKKAIELAKKYPGIVYAAIGVHPEELVRPENTLETPHSASNEETSFACRRALLDLQSGIPFRESPREIVAIGEIGTDASTEELKNCMDEQKDLFRNQCEMALQYDLPVIIHTRNSLDEALEVLDSLKTMPRGQFHCFSHDEDGLKQVLDRGFYVSFCGNITWSKRVARLVGLVPEDKLILETDSPLMVPRNKKSEPIMGTERNEPENVVFLAQKIAELRGVTLKKIADVTTTNVNNLFKL